MGMAASQARFLGLTARKTNIEYEGQQVNQQRTTLSNQSANYYNNLLSMAVPVPPSVDDYTKTTYSFNDGALSNNITSLIAKEGGNYLVSYNSNWSNDFSVVSTGSSLVTCIKGGVITSELYEQFATGTNGGCYTSAVNSYDAAHYAHTFTHMLVAGNYTTSDGKPLTIYPYGSGTCINSRWWSPGAGSGGADGDKDLMDEISAELVGTDLQQEIVDLLYEFIVECNGPGIDGTQKLPDGSRGTSADPSRKDELAKKAQILVGKLKATPGEYEIGATKLRILGQIPDVERNSSGQITKYNGKDAYLKSLSAEQLDNLEKNELLYIDQLNKKYGTDTWYVRYAENTTTGDWLPYFYKNGHLLSANYQDETGKQQSYIPSYTVGTTKECEEIKGVNAKLEQDASGRFINITLNPGTDDEQTYALTTSIVTDQARYDDAMHQYTYDKQMYDQQIQTINAKIEIVQGQDKNLELRLKQLDTEQKAIQTEIDSVSKVIEKNTESSFKIFG